MKRYLILLLMAAAIYSCTKDSTTDVLIDINNEERIYATFASEENRVQLNELAQMVWTAGDYMYVIGPNTRKRYKFNGKTGDKNAVFTRVNTYTPYSVTLDKYYAVAPYGGIGLINSGRIRFHSLSAGISTQEYNPNGCGAVNSNMVFAINDDGENFSFKALLGYLKVSLTGDKCVKSIELINNSGENISGRYYFYIDAPDKIYWNNTPTPQSTTLLDCGDGVQLSGKPTDFYFTLKPMILSEGITIKVTFTDNTIFVQSTSKPITIERNTIHPMAAVSISDESAQTIKIEHTGNRLCMPIFEGETSLSGYVDLGDGTMSLLNFITSYDYTDSKTSHSILIRMRDATKVKFNGCEGITELDLSNF